jgi:hypothetical protein
MAPSEDRGGSSMSQYNRRTIVRGAAWTIPVVAVASTAPAFAASTDTPVVPGPGAFTVCKQPGGPNGPNCQGYKFSLNLTVQPSDTWTIQFTTLTVDGTNFLPQTSPQTFQVTATSNLISFVFCTASSPSQFNMTLRYSATNQRTGVTTSNLGGTYALSGVRNCA